MRGRLSAQGRAPSTCAARRSSSASPAGGPIACAPIGRPSSDQCKGRDIAGSPVRFATAVNGVKAVFRCSCSIAPSTPSSCQPIGTGGSASVGVRTTSACSQKATMLRARIGAGTRPSRSRPPTSSGRLREARFSGVRSSGSTGKSVGPTCQTAMKSSSSPGVLHGGVPRSRRDPGSPGGQQRRRAPRCSRGARARRWAARR